MLSTIAFFLVRWTFHKLFSQLKNSLIMVDCIVTYNFAASTYIDLGERTNKPQNTVFSLLWSLCSNKLFATFLPLYPLKLINSYIFGQTENNLADVIFKDRISVDYQEEIWTIKLCIIAAILHIVACYGYT